MFQLSHAYVLDPFALGTCATTGELRRSGFIRAHLSSSLRLLENLNVLNKFVLRYEEDNRFQMDHTETLLIFTLRELFFAEKAIARISFLRFGQKSAKIAKINFRKIIFLHGVIFQLTKDIWTTSMLLSRNTPLTLVYDGFQRLHNTRSGLGCLKAKGE